jgi:hypothetical protein
MVELFRRSSLGPGEGWQDVIPLGSLVLSRVTCGLQLWDERVRLSAGIIWGSEVGGTPRMIYSEGLCHYRWACWIFGDLLSVSNITVAGTGEVGLQSSLDASGRLREFQFIYSSWKIQTLRRLNRFIPYLLRVIQGCCLVRDCVCVCIRTFGTSNETFERSVATVRGFFAWWVKNKNKNKNNETFFKFRHTLTSFLIS